MTDYAAVLTDRFPDAEWTLNGDDYAGLTWLSDTPPPTKAALDKLWPEVKHERAVAQVQRQRQIRYRAESDPMFFEAQRGDSGVTIADWEAKVAEIKADLPMPSKD